MKPCNHCAMSVSLSKTPKNFVLNIVNNARKTKNFELTEPLMQKQIIFYAICALLTGCSTLIENSKVEEGSDGLYRIEGEQVPEAVLRDKSGYVITDREVAEKTVRELKTDANLIKNIQTTDCSYNRIYRSNELQVEALKSLQAANFQGALQSLDQAQDACSTIGKFTAQGYLKARAYLGLGQSEKAKTSAQDFLLHSSSHNPAIYYQNKDANILSRSPITLQEFREFRDRATAFVNGQSKDLELPQSLPSTAMFYPNFFLKPGGSEIKGPPFIFPQITAGGVAGTGFGLGVYRQQGKFGWGGSYVATSDAGSFYNLKLRRSFYESVTRDLNVDGSIFGVTNKSIRYQKNPFGGYSNVQVLDTSFDPGLTVGATKRFFIPSFGVASEGGVILNQLEKEAKFFGSLYTFYDIGGGGVFSLNAGYIQNVPMVSLSAMHLHVGYNFKDERFDVVARGFYF